MRGPSKGAFKGDFEGELEGELFNSTELDTDVEGHVSLNMIKFRIRYLGILDLEDENQTTANFYTVFHHF